LVLGVQIWAFPVAIGGHWYCAINDFRLEHILVIDSMGRRASHSDVARAAQILTQELFRLGGRAGAVQWAVWRFCSLADATPQQSDEVNCAVFLLVTLWGLGCAIPLATIRQADMYRWRMRLALWATRGVLPQ
jgi:Ulp1 family protease